MRHFNQFCAMLGLMLALSLTALAGQIPCGGVAAPPPPEQGATMASEVLSTLLQSALALF